MTTIAWDGRTVAADSWMVEDGAVVGDVRKLCRLQDGSVVGLYGDIAGRDLFVAWLNGEADSPPDGDYKAILVKPDGRAWYWEGKGQWLEASAPCAVGTGALLALGAMACGRTARYAVGVAIAYDVHSGGDVHTMRPSRR